MYSDLYVINDFSFANKITLSILFLLFEKE